MNKLKKVIKLRNIAITCLIMAVVLSIIAAVLMVFKRYVLGIIITYLALSTYVAFLIIIFCFWRCPNCNTWLYKIIFKFNMNGQICNKCKEQLDINRNKER